MRLNNGNYVFFGYLNDQRNDHFEAFTLVSQFKFMGFFFITKNDERKLGIFREEKLVV